MVLVANNRRNRMRRIRNIILLILLAIALAGAITAFIAFGYYIDSLNVIFPNVWAEGIDMSGLTFDQARQALLDSGYENNADGISVTVIFPYDISFTVTGNDVGLRLSAEQAARAAYGYGRDGSFFANELTYIRAMFIKTELNELSLPQYETTEIRRLAEEYTKVFNESLHDYELDISDSQITIIKGSSYYLITSEEVFNFTELAMRNAIEQHTHIETRFIPQTNYDEFVDLAEIHQNIHIEPISSQYDPQLGNPNLETYDPVNKGATESRDGKTFDLSAAEDKLRDAEHGATVVIPIVTLPPDISQRELTDMLFRDILGEREAWQSSPVDRATNIKLVAEAINGYVMQPGDEFSFNAVVGRRTEERGFKEANAIINGVLRPVIGGGICQVSSAIYSALLRTDLDYMGRGNVSRTIHGLMVSYLPGGQDATVAYGSLDFKFKNTSKYPIMLEVITTGSITVTVRIHGTRVSDVYYRVLSEEHEDSPIDMQIIEREVTPEDGIELAPGESFVLQEGVRGRIFEVYRYHYSSPDFGEDYMDNRILDANGEHIRERISTNTYRMRPRIILHNTSTPAPTPPPDPGPEPDPTDD